ncbi:hypothetical protein NBRC116494_35490 [Aurantivibrio plasticivorans]
MYAVIDLGSNSFHLLIAEYCNDHFQAVARVSRKIQLAEGLNSSPYLSAPAISRGIECLKEFKSILLQYPIERQRVVATQALREAENASDFVSIANELGFEIDIISGEQEAKLIFTGVNDPLPESSKQRLVIDIGGASTEISLGANSHASFAQSLPMGCVKWRDQFFSKSIQYQTNGVKAQDAARKVLAPIQTQLSKLNWQETYSSSGSSKMLASIAEANGWSDGEITLHCIEQVEEQLSHINSIQELYLPGLNPTRLDLLAPGVAILGSIMRALNIQTIQHSRTALREGVLSELTQCRVDYRLLNEAAFTA